MNAIHAIIIDHQPSSINDLKEKLQVVDSSIIVVATATDMEAGKKLIQQHSPVLVFISIAGSDEESYRLLQEITHRNFEIIFLITENFCDACTHHLSPVYCIAKPYLIADLMIAIEKYKDSTTKIAIDSDHQKNKLFNHHMYSIHTLTEIIVISTEDILYLTAQDSYAHFHLKDKRVIIACKPLGYYELNLRADLFLRVHDKSMVGLAHVVSYHKSRGGYVVLFDKIEVEVSARKKEALLNWINSLGS